MIFAAGLGTRLKPLTDTMPKALVSVAGTPLLEHVIRRLQRAGYDDFVINVHHFPEMIERFVRENASFGAKIEFSEEPEAPLETGGGILHARKALEGCGNFLVHNVDILSNADFGAICAGVRPDALATLVVSDRPSSRKLLFDDSMRLVGWTNLTTGEVRTPLPELDPSSCRQLAFSGIHVISDGIFPVMESWAQSPAFPIMDFYLAVAAEHPIYGTAPDGLRLLDVGKVDTLDAANSFIMEFC